MTIDGTMAVNIGFVNAVETMTVNITSDISIADFDFDNGTTAVIINASADLTVAAGMLQLRWLH